MNKSDWKDAPEWATYLITSYIWCAESDRREHAFGDREERPKPVKKWKWMVWLKPQKPNPALGALTAQIGWHSQGLFTESEPLTEEEAKSKYGDGLRGRIAESEG